MSVGSILTTATTGMLRDARTVHQSAARIVQQPVKQTQDQTLGQIQGKPQEATDLATEFVRIKQAEVSYNANATIIRTADDMASTVLDVLA